MALHPRLTEFAKVKNIRRLSGLLSYLERDMAATGLQEFEVEVWEADRPKSALKRMLTLEQGDEAHQALIVRGQYLSHPFTVTLPLRNSRTMPYSLDVVLPVQIACVCRYLPSLKGGKWKLAEASDSLEQQLKSIAMPKIVWTHSAGGYNYNVLAGSTFAPLPEDPTRSIWSIKSGYHGFLFKVGPRVSPYFAALPQVKHALSVKTA